MNARQFVGNGTGGRAQRLLLSADRAQRARPWLAVVAATVRKFMDDRAGLLAGLVAYYAFASVIPLLLVGYTILDIVAHGNAQVADRLMTALSQFPVVGRYLGGSVHQGLGQTGGALVIGIVLTLFGARGIVIAIQHAMNTVWAVPKYQRPHFGTALLRGLGLIALIGPGEILTIALSSFAGGVGHFGGIGAKIAAAAVSLVLNFWLFWLGFQIATAGNVSARNMRMGAILSAIAWQPLQLTGGIFISHATNSAYGVFGVVLGLLAWFYAQAQVTLWAVEFDAVRGRRLWPRSLAPPALTDADMRAYQAYAHASQLRADIAITVTRAPQPSPTADTSPDQTATLGSETLPSEDTAWIVVARLRGLHHDTGRGVCSCGKPTRTCPETALTDASTAFRRWESRQQQQLRRGQPCHLPPEHPARTDPHWCQPSA